MKAIDQKSMVVKLNLADRTLAKPLFDRLRRKFHLSVNILRGRVTDSEASFELEVTGSASGMEKFLRTSAAWEAIREPAVA